MERLKTKPNTKESNNGKEKRKWKGSLRGKQRRRMHWRPKGIRKGVVKVKWRRKASL